MDEEPIDRVESIFTKAVTIGNTEARAAYVQSACVGAPAILARVEALLRAHDRVNPALDDLLATVDHSSRKADHPTRHEQPGMLIAGRYKLLEAIGEGGMGTVWMAEQIEPVRRSVAVKLIKAGMDSRQVLARFEAERQALALMDHPNIARILDGGITDTGRPFFVMDYVKGIPITEYCDAQKLNIHDRLKLFSQVCSAVQHAHQKGIIHRDLKPSNILVAPYDDTPVPKVIDFGLAKTMHQSLTDLTLHTAHGAVLGTPLYMSPEQAQLNNLDIDTRSDIYSLGVLLYELLTGTTPAERKQFKEAAWDVFLRIIREEEPPRPSTRLSTSEALPELAANRRMESAQLPRLVRGELDWIVMKTLEKDRSRRYDSANSLAMDVQRYLTGEPVLAHPPSKLYQFKKYVRRHKAQVTAASLVLLVLLAGIAGTTWGMFQAKHAANAERQAKLEAEANLDYARKGNEILGAVFANFDPNTKYETVAELRNALKTNLLDAAKKLDDLGSGDPVAVAQMRHTLGTSMYSLGETELAIPLFQQAMEVRKAKLGADHPDTLASASSLGMLLMLARGVDQGLPLVEETLNLQKAKLGPDHPDTLRSMGNLAWAYFFSNKRDLALSLEEETLKLRKAKLGADHPDTIHSMARLAGLYSLSNDKYALSHPLLEEAFKLSKARFGASHPVTLGIMNNLAVSPGEKRGLQLLEELYGLQKARLGTDHPLTLGVMSNLGQAYRRAGKRELELAILEDQYKIVTVKYGPDALITMGAMQSLADVYVELKREPEASRLYRENITLSRKKFPPWEHAVGLTMISYHLLSHEMYMTAEPFLRECLAIREKHEPDSWTLHDTQALLGAALLGQKKYAEAEPLLVKGYKGMLAREKTMFKGRTTPIAVPINEIKTRVPEALDRLIQLYEATNKPEEAKKCKELRTKYRFEGDINPISEILFERYSG